MMEFKCTKCGQSIKLVDENKCPYCHYKIEPLKWQLVIEHYLRQENAVMDYLDRVPYQGRQKFTYSPFLFDTFFNVGGGIEQIFKSIADWELFDNVNNVDLLRYKRKKRKKPDEIQTPIITDYTEALKPYLIFGKHQLKLKTTYDVITPFARLKYSGKGPRWPEFKIYSSYKHRWIDQSKEFTIHRLIRLLGAYFILVCLNPREGNYESLYSKGMFAAGPCRNVGISFEIEARPRVDPYTFWRIRKIISYGWNPKKEQPYLLDTPYCVKFESNLFIFSFEIFLNYQSSSSKYVNIRV